MYRLHCIVLLTVFLFISFSDETTVKEEHCPPFRCGNTHYPYPFWQSNGTANTNDYCGYPSFGLTCSDEDGPAAMATLRLRSGNYFVKNIHDDDKTFTAVDPEVADIEFCPRVSKNVSLNEYSQLSFAPPFDTFLHFFFNCTPPAPGQYMPPISPLPCFQQTSFVFISGMHPPGYDWFGKCFDNVLAPVVLTPEQRTNSYYNFVGAFPELLRSGFQLTWTPASDCTACEETHGRCGRRGSSFVCICDDEIYDQACKHHGKSSRGRRYTLIGVLAGGLGGMAAMLAVVIICYKRRKRLVKASSVLLARNTSPYGSSSYDLEKSIGKSMNYPTHVFSYLELDEATNSFDSSNELGDGGFGTVYYGKLKDGRSVAVKKLYENNLRRVEQFLNELQILSLLRHQNLVTLYGCTSRHSRELLLVYEYIPNGTVADHLHGKMSPRGGLTWPIRLSIAVETAEALAYLHAVDPPIIHRDVKTNNILLDNNFRVKVADFGLSRLFPLDVTHISTTPQGTPGYLDPDYHKCYQLTDKSDVYSFGVVLAELISSKPAVDITRHRHDINLANMIINKIRNAALDEFVDSSLGYCSDHKVKKEMTYMAEVAFRCLGEEKDDRPSMDEVTAELKRIQRGELHCTGTRRPADGGVNAKEDVCLLKSIPPPSPDTVMGPWHSTLTTPNTSS